MKSPAARRIAVLAYCAGIFYLSSRADYPKTLSWYPEWLPDYHLFAHFFLFAGLSYVVWHDFRGETIGWLRHRAMAAAVIFCSLYGLSDEIHQTFVPGRRFECRDLLMDTLGPVAVMAVVAVLRRRGPFAKSGRT